MCQAHELGGGREGAYRRQFAATFLPTVPVWAAATVSAAAVLAAYDIVASYKPSTGVLAQMNGEDIEIRVPTEATCGNRRADSQVNLIAYVTDGASIIFGVVRCARARPLSVANFLYQTNAGAPVGQVRLDLSGVLSNKTAMQALFPELTDEAFFANSPIRVRDWP